MKEIINGWRVRRCGGRRYYINGYSDDNGTRKEEHNEIKLDPT